MAARLLVCKINCYLSKITIYTPFNGDKYKDSSDNSIPQNPKNSEKVEAKVGKHKRAHEMSQVN